MTSEAEFRTAYENIKTSYQNVLKEIDKAVSHEENERPMEAIASYEHCIQQIDETFAISVGLPENFEAVESEWNDACKIIQKLKGVKTEMVYRLKLLHAQHAPIDQAAEEASEISGTGGSSITDGNNERPAAKKKSVLLENPATHYDISTANGSRKTYREIISELRNAMATKDSGILFDTLFQSQVKLYKIQPNGVVSTIAGDTSMSLVMCTVGDKWKLLNGICFIQCTIPDEVLKQQRQSVDNDEGAAASNTDRDPVNMIWIYPLIPTVTTCFRTEYGAFILPDLESDEVGAAFGIMISSDESLSPDNEEHLADLQQFFLDLLEAVLSGTVEELKAPTTRPPRDTSEQVSRHIIGAADFIARNLVRGAEKTGELMIKTTPYIISKMNPAPADAAPVSSKVQTSVEVAKNVTGVAVGVTGWVAGKVGSASMAVGRFLAPHLQSSGATLLEKGFGYDSTEANSKMEGAMTIAAGAVEGFCTVYTGLEQSAKILGTNLSDNSVKIIEHKYGPSAGNVAAETFDTLGNAFIVSQNVNYITPKGIAKKMVKNTGKAVVDEHKRNLRKESHFVPAGSLYPDLRCVKN